MRILIVLAVLACCPGCETITETVDQWFTQGSEGEASQAERVTESTKWLIPSPYSELVTAVIAGFAGFWTARKRQQTPPKE